MKSLVGGAIVLAAVHVGAVSGASQSGTPPSDKKPNIAVSGCLMRQGYATFIVAEARLDEELGLIPHHGLAGFFLVYHQVLGLATDVAAEVRAGLARSHAGLPPGRGRGSG